VERAAYEARPSSLDESLPPVAFDADRPAKFVLIHLLRTLVLEAKAYQPWPHDGLQPLHDPPLATPLVLVSTRFHSKCPPRLRVRLV
jgi:hypothetical protein